MPSKIINEFASVARFTRLVKILIGFCHHSVQDDVATDAAVDEAIKLTPLIAKRMFND